MTPEAALAELRERLAEVSDLGAAGILLEWDQQTMMPRGGAQARAEAIATVSRLAHERFTDERIGELLESLDGADDPLVRVTRRDFEKARRVPDELVSDMARAASLGQQTWERARAESDYAAFLPALERNVELRRQYIACFDVEDPYDALLDDFEPEMKTSEVQTAFDALRDGLVPLVAAIREREQVPELPGPFPVEHQRTLAMEVVAAFGYDPESWRVDDAAHPFMTTPGLGDVRITSRYDERSLESLFSTMHETGHGLYEAGVDPSLARTPLHDGCSMALHESQSRLWENQVGRSRAFWQWALPRARERFPQLPDLDTTWRSVNRVEPSLIRVDADEVTYGLHVILRFDLERAIFSGELDLADLPAVWNDRMRSDLGVEVPDDARGCLQDVHWAAGLFGYFPTYALGNIVAGQIWDRVRVELADLEAGFAEGRFSPLREWLRENLHRHGRSYTPRETIELVAGAPLDPAPYLAYLRGKAADVYGV